MLTYCGQAGLPRWLEILGRHLTYRWQFVCVNADGHSIAPTRGGYGILNGFRCLLLFSKGPFRPFRSIKDTLVTDGAEKGLHEWQQPLSEALYYRRAALPARRPGLRPLPGGGDDRIGRTPGRRGSAFPGWRHVGRGGAGGPAAGRRGGEGRASGRARGGAGDGLNRRVVVLARPISDARCGRPSPQAHRYPDLRYGG